jgi:3-dehydroquinate dehydratase / shikimate dehydrogenase
MAFGMALLIEFCSRAELASPAKSTRRRDFSVENRNRALQPGGRIITICAQMTVPRINYSARSLRLRIPRICVSITSDDAAELMEKAEAVLRENSLVELRLDYLESPLAAMPRLRKLCEARPDAILIGTCRRKSSGGNFPGSLEQQLEVLRKAAEAGCLAVDVEIESAESINEQEWEELRSLAAIVLSSHDFETTSRLEETFARMRDFNADFYKVVGTATCLHDNVVITRFLEEHCQEYSMVGMCMGEQGMLSRVLAIRAGAAFTFGSEAAGRATAPGQPTYRELRDLYRIEQLETVTKVYGIAGDPVSHSMSPYVMNAAFRRENANAVYLPLHARTLSDLLATITDLPLDGVSITMPYKQSIVEHLDNSDVITQRTGACNTIVRGKDGRLFGFNTDVYGIVAAIEPRLALQGAKVLVLGAGGAARAAIFGLRAKGAEVWILNRTAATGAELAKLSGSKTVKREEIAKMSFDLIFNATPVGMGSSQESPLNEDELNSVWVFDSVYNPIETPLIKMAQAKGCGTIRQFEIWTGKPAPLDSVRQVLLRQLGATSAESGAVTPTIVAPKGKVASTAAAAAAAEASEEHEEALDEDGELRERREEHEPVRTAKASTARATAAKSEAAKSAAARATAPRPAGAKPAAKTVTTPEKQAAKAVAAKATAKPATVKAAAKAAKAAAKAPAKGPAKKAAVKKR